MSGLYFMKFYPSDWTKDTRALTLPAKGAWIDILCALHHSATRGRLTLTIEEWSRVIGASSVETSACITELRALGLCDYTCCNGAVTLVSRRMLREGITREQTRQRVAKHRHKSKGNSGTAPSQLGEKRTGNRKVTGKKHRSTEAQKQEAQKQEAQKSEIRNNPIQAPSKSAQGGEEAGKFELTSQKAEEKEPAKARQRDPLFDALARSCGSDPREMTKPGKRACAVALADIRQVCPTLTPETIEARARRYVELHRTWTLTPSALSVHWGELGDNVQPSGEKPREVKILYQEDEDAINAEQRNSGA